VTRAGYALHLARYYVAYRLGMPALRAACRILPTRTVVAIRDHYGRRGDRAAVPHRYGVTYPRNGWQAAVGVDRFDVVTDLEGVAWWSLQRRARRALHRLDVATAAAEGRPLPR
jgi:hypothetical protein